MDHKGSGIRLRVLAGIFLAVMAVFLGVLYDTQVNDYEYYYASSIRTIARPEAVGGRPGQPDGPGREGAGVQPPLLQPDLRRVAAGRRPGREPGPAAAAGAVP